MGDWVGIFITLISLFFGGFVLGVKWGEGKPLLDIKEYLKQTKTVLVTQDAFDELVKKASAQPERKTGRWIPCSERLPGKHGEMYLVTISDGAIYSAALQWDINRKRWYLSFLNNGEILIDYIDDVIAWQPLPEPYREGEG